MGFDRPGIAPASKSKRRKPPRAPAVRLGGVAGVVGAAAPKRPRKASADGGVFGPRGRAPVAETQRANVARVQRSRAGRDPVRRQPPKGAPPLKRPKADTGDILASLSPRDRKRLRDAQPTRSVAVRGADGTRRRVTVMTGNILSPRDVEVLRRANAPHKLSYLRALQDELEGKGVIAAEASKLADYVGKNAYVTSTGGGPGVSSRILSGGGAPRGTAAVLAPGRAANVKDAKILKRALEDAVRLPTGAVQGLFELGAAGVEGAQGRTSRGKRLIGGLDDGALGRLVIHADPKGAAKVAGEHPLFAALEVTGAGQVVGRVAGAGARAGLLGAVAKRAGSTRRAPLRVEGTNQRQERRYSANLGVKGVQVAVERAQRRRGLDPNVARGKKRERLMNAEVDEFAAQAEGVRRRGREEVARSAGQLAPVRRGAAAKSRAGRAVAAVDRARSRGAEASVLPGVRGRSERGVVLAAVEGRLRGPKTFRLDVAKERARLQTVYMAERSSMSAGARRANREQVKALDRVLADTVKPATRAVIAREVFRAADDYNRHGGAIEKELIAKGALDVEQAATARVRTYAIAHMGLKPNPKGKGLVDRSGRVVPTSVIQSHIRLHGNREPGFVGHRRDERGAASYFVNWFGGRKTVDSKRRTGEAARIGGYDASFHALEQQLVRGRGVADAIGTFDHFIGRFGTKRRDGTPFTWDEAERSAGELGEATGMKWLPVRAVPARYDEATRDAILNSQGTASMPGHLESLTLGRLDDSTRPPAVGERQARNVVLVPAQQLQRFAAHQTSGSSTGGRVGQVGTRAFRNTVLPFSTKWLFGNTAEAVLRSATAGVGPLDVVRGGRVMRSLRSLDEAAWKAADTRIRGGLLYGSAERLNVRRGAEDFEGTVLHGPALALGQVARLPVVRQTIAGLGVYSRAVFSLNRGIERAFQTGVIGKAARKDAQELTGSWAKAVRMQKDVAGEVARGMLGTPKQVQFARMTDEILGKYSRFSPGTRRFIQTFAPFLPWFLNAGRFVYHTLPARHPAKTALLANIEMTLQDDIEAHKKTVPPGDLESAIRLKDGGLLNLARYTPFGAFTKGAEGVPEPLLPQIDSAVEALHGRSFTGRALQLEGAGPREPVPSSKRLWLAFYTLLEGAVPGIQIIRRAREGGATAFDDSTVLDPKTKPGTARGGAADRILNPLRPTYLSGASSGSDLDGLPPVLRKRAEALRQAAGGSSSLEQALQRRAEAIRAAR